MTLSMPSSDEALRLHTGRFAQFLRIPAISCGTFSLAEFVLMLATGNRQLLGLAVLTLGFALTAHLASVLASSMRLEAGVYTWSLGSSILMALLPLVASDLLPAVMAGTTVNILIVALFLSPREIKRATVIVAILVMLSTLLDRWAPGSRVNMRTDLLPILVIVNVGSIAAIAFLIQRSGESLLSALESSQAHAGQLEQSRAALLERATDLEKLGRALRVTGQQAERRASQLAASAQVAHAASQVRDLDQLLSQVTHLISQAFGHYHVGIFIVDESRHHAVLRGANSEGGQRMLARGHKLVVGTQGIVGFVTGSGQPRVALDVGADTVYFRNPDLPQTRSEMALPMRAGDQVIGALDVQSTREAAFTEDDVAVLSTLADQLAIAIENARLFQQTRSALQELEATNRLLVREGWEGYLELPTTVRRAEARAAGATVAESPAGPLTVPLELRGQPLGRLTLHREQGRAWSDDEVELIEAIALQTTMAAENARLIEQTRRALNEARALYETSREITSAGEMSEVLAAVLNNLAHTGIHAAAIALFDAPTREKANHIELAGAWDHTGTPRLAPGVRFAIADFPLFDRIKSGEALVSQDLLSDPAIDDTAKRLLGGLGLRAMAVTPLVARGQWIGVLFALMEQPHPFTAAELNFQRALADQAAIAIDGRRLLAETQRRAERERLIRQITTRIRAASDIQGVLEATAAELAKSMAVPRAIVRLTMGDSA